MVLYVNELKIIENEYNQKKNDPPLARNLPPTSGKIAWSRQLYRHITAPVELFQQRPEVMKMGETKRAIKSYNKLARVLVEYEMVFLRMWNQQIDQAKSSLNSTVLVRDPDTREPHINLDRSANELLREIEVMTKMGLQLTPSARAFRAIGLELREKNESLAVSSSKQTHFFLSVFMYMCVTFTKWHADGVERKQANSCKGSRAPDHVDGSPL